MKQVSHLIKQNKSLQSIVGTLLEKEKDREKTLNTVENYLEALSTRSFADCMSYLSYIYDSSDAEDSITINDGLKSAAEVSSYSNIKSLTLHNADPKDTPKSSKGIIVIGSFRR